ncbi:MAG: hypothetical protein KY475_23860, partial [Planctomycetes bacterium]|nr:hypothetical protein [Planctomycetota bacterium]
MAAFSHLRCPFLVLVALAVGGGALAVAHPGHDHSDDDSGDRPPADFVYDPAGHAVASTVLEDAMWYDADVAASDGAVWYAWLEFTSGKGDRVWVGRRENGGWAQRTLATEQFGSYAHPTLTVDARGRMWLSYEAEHEQQWDVLLVRLDEQGRPATDVRRVSPGAGADVSHQVAADAEGLWFVWQSDEGGQF